MEQLNSDIVDSFVKETGSTEMNSSVNSPIYPQNGVPGPKMEPKAVPTNKRKNEFKESKLEAKEHVESDPIEHMPLTGWGRPGQGFNPLKRPYFDAFIEKNLKVPSAQKNLPESLKAPHRFLSKDLHLSPTKLKPDQLENLASLVSEHSRTEDSDLERALHSFGKSYRDLYRARLGDFKSVPDAVIYPSSSEDVQNLIRYCNAQGIQVIPFGGGTNIVGGVEVLSDKPTVCLDMKLMNKVLEVDEVSHVARIQAGALGPIMEEQLGKQGWTLGHFPDSFEFSTLGGWIATRSAGMQSDKYGKIEDMVVALTMVTPIGDIRTLEVPASSSGIDLKHMLIGSEGIFGVITEALMQVHRQAETKIFNGYFFPTFESGVAALRECAQKDIRPVINRLNDPHKTQMSIAFKEESKGLKQDLVSRAFKKYMFDVKKFDPDKIAMCLTAFEGSPKEVAHQKKLLDQVFKKYGALSVGDSPGKTFNETKYDFPYIRDYVMDRNIVADVSETCTTWSGIESLHRAMITEFEKCSKDLGVPIFLACHISHTYHSGASLYFTWASPQRDGLDPLEHYDRIKSLTEDVFVTRGATLSHHHATGYEHKKWIEKELTPTGVIALKGLKNTLDPKSIMNLGKIIDL